MVYSLSFLPGVRPENINQTRRTTSMIDTFLNLAALGLVVIGLILTVRVAYLRSIAQQALSILWRKKYLWFIGFFAGLLFGRGEPDYLFQNLNSSVYSFGRLQDYLTAIRDVVQKGEAHTWWTYVQDLFQQAPGLMTAYIVLPLLFGMILLWLISVSQGSLVNIIARLSEKKPASLFEGISAGTTAFWRVLSINLLSVLMLLVVTVLFVGIPAAVYFIGGQSGWASVTSVMLFVVTVPVSMLMSFLVKFSVVSTVIEGTAPLQAFRQTWVMVKQNLMAVLELSFVIYALTLIVYSLVLSVTSFYIQPTSFLNLGLLLGITGLTFALTTTFSYTCWTLMFMRLRQGTTSSAFGKWTTRLVNFTKPKQTIS